MGPRDTGHPSRSLCSGVPRRATLVPALRALRVGEVGNVSGQYGTTDVLKFEVAASRVAADQLEGGGGISPGRPGDVSLGLLDHDARGERSLKLLRERGHLPFEVLAIADVVPGQDVTIAGPGDDDLELTGDTAFVEGELITERLARLYYGGVRVEESVCAVRREQVQQPSSDHLFPTAIKQRQRGAVAVLILEIGDAAGRITHGAHPEASLVDGLQERTQLFPGIIGHRPRREVLRRCGRHAEVCARDDVSSCGYRQTSPVCSRCTMQHDHHTDRHTTT